MQESQIWGTCPWLPPFVVEIGLHSFASATLPGGWPDADGQCQGGDGFFEEPQHLRGGDGRSLTDS